MIKLKSAEDIIVLKEGGRILALILDELEKLVIPGNTTLDIDDLAMELIQSPEAFYVNVHNAPFPAGAVRGQLGKGK